MVKRKIQLIAGTTYSVSLPKEWIKKNNLKQKNEVELTELNDFSLIINAFEKNQIQKNISLNLDELNENTEQILFAVYYLGAETITVYSKNKLSDELKSNIKKALTSMTGAVISHEDNKKITIDILMDSNKLNIIQLLYRICLIIDSSITLIQEKKNLKSIEFNENEVDALFNLNFKLISISLTDSKILINSGIKKLSFILSFFLINKKLENIHDDLFDLNNYLIKFNKKIEEKEILEFIKKEILRFRKHCQKQFSSNYIKSNKKELNQILNQIKKTSNPFIQDYYKNILRLLIDIQEETITLSYYNQLSENKLL